MKEWKIDKIRGALCGLFIGANGFEGIDRTGVCYQRNKIKDLMLQLLHIFDGHVKLLSLTYQLQKSALSEFAKKEKNINQLCSIQPSGQLNVLYDEDKDVRIDFYNQLLNRIMNNSESLTQQALSQEGGKLLSTLYGNRWKYSSDYIFLIQLYNNVTRYDNFDLSSNESVILRSFAAFVQRGLGEWDKLRDYLNERNDILPDRRFVYGLYGALNGFSTLSKTLTDTSDISDNAITDFINDINEKSLIDIDNAFTENDLKNSDKEEAIVTTPADDLGNKVKKIVASHPRIKISDNDRKTIEWAIDKAPNDGGTFINIIAEKLDNITKGIFPCLQKELNPDWKPIKAKRGTKIQKNAPQEQSFFGNLFDGISKKFEPKTDGEFSGKSIIYDVHTEDVLNECSFLPFDIKKQIIDLFKGFQKNYQDGFYYKNQEKYKRNNTDVIDHFVKWCLSPKNKRAIKWSPENSKLMDELKLYLMNVYAD